MKGLSAACRAHLDSARLLTKGTMGIAVDVNADELDAARAYLKGKKWGALIELGVKSPDWRSLGGIT